MLQVDVRQSLFRLPRSERQQLGAELLASVGQEDANQREVASAWRQVVHQRANDILDGTAQTVDAFEAIDEILAELQVAN